MPPELAVKWKADLPGHLEEMYNHGCYVFAGQHTRLSVVVGSRSKSIKKQTGGSGVPPEWLNWKTRFLALPGPLVQYQRELDVIGEFDNEPINLPPSFKDRIFKLRDRWASKWDHMKTLLQRNTKIPKGIMLGSLR